MTYLVTAVIKAHRVDAVKDAVNALGVQGMTVIEVKGHRRGASLPYRHRRDGRRRFVTCPV